MGWPFAKRPGLGHGLGNKDYGLRTTDDGRRTTDSGQRAAEYGHGHERFVRVLLLTANSRIFFSTGSLALSLYIPIHLSGAAAA